MKTYCGTKGLRYIPEENMHLTLHFLGNIQEHMVDDICELLYSTCLKHSAGSYFLKHAGSFDTNSIARVVWAGIDDTDHTIMKFHRSLKHGLIEAGLPFDKRTYIPHLTLAYVKNLPSQLQTNLMQLLPDLITIPVSGMFSTVSLKQSVLKPEGAVHTTLYECELL